MRVIDYLKAKYGINRPTTLLYAEMQAFGIEYPLQKGWIYKHGEKEITPDIEKKLRVLLNKLISKDTNRKDSAQRGIKILDDAYLTIKTIPEANSPYFLRSKNWLRLRIEALKRYGNKCVCCGATPQTGAVLNVDHIKPRKLFPELSLDINNLQILCSTCNEGKGNWDMTSWQTNSTKS